MGRHLQWCGSVHLCREGSSAGGVAVVSGVGKHFQWCGSVHLCREASEVGGVGVLSGVEKHFQWCGSVHLCREASSSVWVHINKIVFEVAQHGALRMTQN